MCLGLQVIMNSEDTASGPGLIEVERQMVRAFGGQIKSGCHSMMYDSISLSLGEVNHKQIPSLNTSNGHNNLDS